MNYTNSVCSVRSVVRVFFEWGAHFRAYIEGRIFFALRCCLKFRSFYDLNLFRASSLESAFFTGKWSLDTDYPHSMVCATLFHPISQKIEFFESLLNPLFNSAYLLFLFLKQ